MNILIVSTRPPLPMVRGDQVLLINRMRELSARGHRVFLCFVHSADEELRIVDELSQYCAGVYPHRIGRLRQAFNLLTHGVASATPLQVILYRDPRLSHLVSVIAERERIDVINPFLIRSCLAVDMDARPVVVDLIDSMRLNVHRRRATAPLWMRPVLAIEERRLRRYEREVCQSAASGLVVARQDLEVIDSPRVFVVPLGVDAEEFHPSPEARVPRRVVFTGNMNYHANRLAVSWFVRSCWPRIHDRYGDAEFCIAGNGAERLTSPYAEIPGVKLVGRVSSMGDFLRTADVSVVPMRSGSGMQNKVLEAMACGVPTVVSSLGLGDIRARHGAHTLVADTDVEVVDTVARLFEDEGLRRTVGAGGAELVRAEYSWSRNATEFERIALASVETYRQKRALAQHAA